ncbi:ABC transporter permease [Reticulibacter mediterranei]|uniref:ABC transporter permease n=1 Tax=Reticulibacter mediterranei TaxID=2778369 RepID=A0A8J3IJU4_9CHLR|nr:ABC transporter permease [Reticulibacter mediterranei]GHO93778.1 ABC transporter permease [Reticulibacter mediterranei]
MANTIPISSQVEAKPRRFRLDSGAILLSLPAVLLVLGLFFYPLIFGLDLSLRANENAPDWSLTNYIQFFSDPDQVATIWTTFQVALPVTIFSVAVSVPLAYFMRQGIKFERLLTAILILPITLGTVMVAQSMLGYFAPNGWFNRALLSLHIIQQPILLLHHLIAVEIALFIQGFPFTFLLILGYMSAINPNLERASSMLGANPWQTFWRIIFPLSLPGIAVAFCLNFVANFSVFPSANLVGEPARETRVLAIAAYETAFTNYNRPLGTTIALIMGVIELLVILLVLWLQNRMARSAAISGGKGV